MQNTTENQAIKRFAPGNRIDAAIKCRPYTSSGTAHASDGVMRDFSNDGFYIETSHKFDTGEILIVQMVSYPPITSTMTDRERPRTICLAEVKWQRELSDLNTIRYGLCLRYLD